MWSVGQKLKLDASLTFARRVHGQEAEVRMLCLLALPLGQTLTLQGLPYAVRLWSSP